MRQILCDCCKKVIEPESPPVVKGMEGSWQAREEDLCAECKEKTLQREATEEVGKEYDYYHD